VTLADFSTFAVYYGLITGDVVPSCPLAP
jgi:hypothetical protein